MNGHWTAAILPEGANVWVGHYEANTFGAFADRCTELGLYPKFMLDVPEESRNQFYEGRAVLLVLSKENVISVINLDHGIRGLCEKGAEVRKISESKKK
jgi:hypothetical protein